MAHLGVFQTAGNGAATCGRGVRVVVAREGAGGVMLDLEDQVGFDPGQRRQEVIQDLIGCHPELAAAGADLEPAALVR